MQINVLIRKRKKIERNVLSEVGGSAEGMGKSKDKGFEKMLTPRIDLY